MTFFTTKIDDSREGSRSEKYKYFKSSEKEQLAWIRGRLTDQQGNRLHFDMSGDENINAYILDIFSHFKINNIRYPTIHFHKGGAELNYGVTDLGRHSNINNIEYVCGGWTTCQIIRELIRIHNTDQWG